jgi:hypothetical protein
MDNKNLYYTVAKAFSEIGLSIKTVFPDFEIAKNQYENHKWYVFKRGDFTIVHAVPTENYLDDSFWEQWSGSSNEDPEHHVLFRRTPPVKHNRIYEAKADHDDINPAEVSGSIWYVVDQVSPLAWALKIF